MRNPLRQNIISIIAVFLTAVFASGVTICVLKLQEASISIQSLEGQVNGLQAQVKDWQEKYSQLAAGLADEDTVIIKKMGVTLVSPSEDTEITDSVLVQGYANVFEGTVNLRLKDANGQILTSGLAMGCMGFYPCYFEKELKFSQPETDTEASLEAYTISAKDGSEQDLISVRLKIKGAGTVLSLQALPDEIANHASLIALLGEYQVSKVAFVQQGEVRDLEFPSDDYHRHKISIEDAERDGYTVSPSDLFLSPDKKRAVYFPGCDYCDPDSYVYLLNRKFDDYADLLTVCGTPCYPVTGFWLDNNRFVYAIDGDADPGGQDPWMRKISLHFFDLRNNTGISYVSEPILDQYTFDLYHP